MRQQFCVVLIGMAISAASLMAQGSAAKPADIVIIGCLQAGPQNAFTLKDYRSDRSYRIDAKAEDIAWHVGHELEIRGVLEVRSEGPVVKADQVVYVANRCSPPAPGPK